MDSLVDRISKGESMELEFKSELPDEDIKWLKTVIAFANGSGGTLVIGVDDDGNTIGVPEDDIYTLCDRITQKISDLCYPQVMFETSAQDLDKGTVIILDVYPGANRPYYLKRLGINNGTFVRVASSSRQADEFTIADLRIQGSGTTFDVLQNHEIDISDENTELMCRELSQIGKRPVDYRVLKNCKVIRHVKDKDVATNAYALLSHDSPFAFTEFRCAVFKGTDGVEFIDQANYSCPIYEQIENAQKFVLRNIRLAGKVNGLVRNDTYELPVDAIRELIINAVQHRSYVDHTRPIYLAIFDDRLEITSPGGLPAMMTEDLMRQGRTFHRNPAISSIIRYVGISEGWGNGIRTVIKQCEEYGLPEPKIENSGIDVRVTVYRMPGNKSSGTGGTDSGTGGTDSGTGGTDSGTGGTDSGTGGTDSSLVHNVLLMISADPGIHIQDLCIGTGASRRSINRIISLLKKEGILERIGNTRSGQWVVKRPPEKS